MSQFAFLVFVLLLPPLRSSLFPYTTLFRSLFGRPLDELPGTPIDDLVASSERQDVAELERRALAGEEQRFETRDRKSTRLNSSHTVISYAVFCLKKKKPSDKQPHVLAEQIQ